MSDATFPLSTIPVHLGLGATIDVLEPFDGSMEWYERYGAGHADDGVEGRLVSIHTFDAPWDTWEMHPLGHELVVCTSGRLTLHQELDGGVRTVLLETGEAVITAGMGTELRPR